MWGQKDIISKSWTCSLNIKRDTIVFVVLNFFRIYPFLFFYFPLTFFSYLSLSLIMFCLSYRLYVVSYLICFAIHRSLPFPVQFAVLYCTFSPFSFIIHFSLILFLSRFSPLFLSLFSICFCFVHIFPAVFFFFHPFSVCLFFSSSFEAYYINIWGSSI